MDILVWGTGRIAQSIVDDISRDVRIVGFIDNDPIKRQRPLRGYRVFSPEEALSAKQFDFLLIAVALVAQEIFNQLIVQYKIPRHKILSLGHFWDPWALSNNYSIIENKLGIKNNYRECGARPEDLVLLRRMEWDAFSKSLLDDQDSSIYTLDYVRYRTFELCADELLIATDTAIDGTCLAEVGVYRGDFAKIINAKFPEKKLFLFDTFEGFDDSEYKKDLVSEGVDSSYVNNFRDTSVELVLKKMPSPRQCVIKKGLFPESARGCEGEKFCFVSIDVDLFDPIYNSLEFFYPRLIDGGYMFIHEYNHNHYTGVKKAVRRFEDRYGSLKKTPLADKNGTLVITK
jgi:O-methyltransferase